MSVVEIKLTLDMSSKRNLAGIVEQIKEVIAGHPTQVLFINDSPYEDGVPFYEVGERIHIKSMGDEIG